MKLVISGIENKIDFLNNINVLEIRDKKFFERFLLELNNIINNKAESDNILLVSECEEIEKIYEYAIIIFDIFNIDFNSKEILNKLYMQLYKDSMLDDKVEEKYKKIIKKLVEYTTEKVYELPFDCDINENVTFKEVLKMLSLKINTDNYYNLIDKIIFLIDLVSEFKITEVLIFVNLKIYLNCEEVEEIYKYAMYKNVKLLIVENIQNDAKVQYENKLVIDSDFDEFLC